MGTLRLIGLMGTLTLDRNFPIFPILPILPISPVSLNQRDKFLVRSVPSATLGKNPDDGLCSKYCSLSGFFLGAAIDHLSQEICPEAVQIAIFVHCCYVGCADVDISHGSIFKVDTNAAIVGLDVDKGDVVLRCHGVMNTTHLNTYLAVAKERDYRHVLLATGIYDVGLQKLHLLATADHRNTRINNLDCYITAQITLIKLCLNPKILIVNNSKMCSTKMVLRLLKE